MHVIFWDIDGVLNCTSGHQTGRAMKAESRKADLPTVERVSYMAEACRASARWHRAQRSLMDRSMRTGAAASELSKQG
jgi:hypothetical protein